MSIKEPKLSEIILFISKGEGYRKFEKEVKKLRKTRWHKLRKETLNGEPVILLELSSYDERVDKIIKVGGRRLCDDKLTTGFLVEEIGV